MDYRCPVDGTILEAKTSHRGRVYSCPECGGEMVGYAVLRKDPALRSGVKKLWSDALQTKTQEGKTCPICNRGMTRVTVEETGCRIDLCLPCQNIWLDMNEYEALPVQEVPVNSPDDLYEGLPEHTRAKMARAMLIEKRYESEAKESNMPRTWQLVPVILGLPAEDEKVQVSRMPYTTWILAAVCVIVFLITSSDLSYYVKNWGFVNGGPLGHTMITVFTSFFLHAGWWHLIANMYYLVVFGDNVEDEIGAVRFLLLVFAGNFFGTMLYALLSMGENIPTIGASAGIAAVLVYYVILYPRSYIRILVLRFSSMKMRAYGFLILWIILQLISAFTQVRSRGGGVNAIAHLGGAAVGFVWGMTMRGKRDSDQV